MFTTQFVIEQILLPLGVTVFGGVASQLLVEWIKTSANFTNKKSVMLG